ncbi:zinc finger MYM-type protein 1-like [Arachis ipaensis]|uniref:zinc finger MYM-type protein 1-like n=1 Tax=Arachis ipaensis TaxID=130454 RepID=UPI0007AF5024|nr:zinc finger MYM-type protein 1-like [Arachis ipaensis]XP_025665109.1 zinc finger MYM-type protein 1-like [Arachis hypogaea]
MEVCHLVRDPGIRPMIWKFHPSKRDEIRRAYLKAGPNQPIFDKYPFSSDTSHPRRFQASWFELYPSWLEYSIEDDAVYCLPCYIFAMKSSINTGSNAFIENGFRNWKKATKSCDDLMKQLQHVDTLMKQQTLEEIENNWRRLGASIDCIRWLTFQGCALEAMMKARVQIIEKEILHVLATMVRNSIRKDIGDAKFCIIIDEARDESKKEQMAIVLRFVDVDGFVRERFFDLVHVSDTNALILKKELVSLLSIYNLQIENIRGQGYDGASNMRGEWNGLQALFLNDCRQAYYVHYFAHRLQLALVAASRKVLQIHEFFTQLTAIVNIVSASYKRHDQLQEAQEIENAKLIANDELETGQGAN